MIQIEILTIAIPVYERKEYFIAAMESVLKQTVKCKIIVVDNASSHDYFKNVCLNFNIPYYRNSSNIGMFANWNKCFELAQSEYVMILGDDDTLDNRYVETFINSLNKHKQLDVFYSNFLLNKVSQEVFEKHTHKLPFGYEENGEKVIEYGIRYGIGFPVISSVIKKSIFRGFYTSEHGSNDWLWAYQNISLLKVCGSDLPLLKYGVHPAQESKTSATHMKIMLSIAYIYGVVLSGQVEDKFELLRISNRRERDAFIYFLSIASNSFLWELGKSQYIYGRYFKGQIKAHPIFSLGLLFPAKIRFFVYRVLRKLNLVGKI